MTHWHDEETPPPPAIRWLGELVVLWTVLCAALWVLAVLCRLGCVLAHWIGRAF